MLAELRHALRLLRRAPAFTAAAVLTLAIGIGANVAVFTFVDAVLFRPLPFVEPDRLVSISESHHETGQDRAGVLPGSFADWRERSRSFESLAMHARTTFLVTNRNDPARVLGASVSPSFFEVLGITPVLGRTFPTTDEAMTGHEREIVISHGLWQRWFGGRARCARPGTAGQRRGPAHDRRRDAGRLRDAARGRDLAPAGLGRRLGARRSIATGGRAPPSRACRSMRLPPSCGKSRASSRRSIPRRTQAGLRLPIRWTALSSGPRARRSPRCSRPWAWCSSSRA